MTNLVNTTNKSLTSWRRFWLTTALVCTPCGALGCGGAPAPFPTYEVKGRVLLANKKPLTQGRVTFVAADGLRPPASGELEPDGGFTLTTKVPGDGAAAGDFKVKIEPTGAQGKGRGKARLAFPLKYIDEDSSNLKVTVRPGSNRLDPITLR